MVVSESSLEVGVSPTRADPSGGNNVWIPEDKSLKDDFGVSR